MCGLNSIRYLCEVILFIYLGVYFPGKNCETVGRQVSQILMSVLAEWEIQDSSIGSSKFLRGLDLIKLPYSP